jgi:chloramphenicol 3-O-phosphotransferase
MRLVYLYGPPGVGKLTVARALAALTDFKLLHNHLTVNLVTALFPFGSASFMRLIRQFRDEMVTEAARVNIDMVITGVYLGTREQTTDIRARLEPVYASGGSALFVRLVCDREVWLARVPNESRRHEGKLLDPDRAVGLFNGEDPFSIMPIEPTLTLDTTWLPPTEAAAQIVAHFDLPLVGAAPGT